MVICLMMTQIPLSDMSRHDRFENRDADLLIRFDKISMLVKTPGFEDSDNIGRVRDNLAILMEFAVSVLESLNASFTLKKNHQLLNTITRNIFETVQNFEDQFNRQNQTADKLIRSLTDIIGNPAMTEGMNPIYRDVFNGILLESRQNYDQIKKKGLAIDHSFFETVKKNGW